jgi:hypothetical protein
LFLVSFSVTGNMPRGENTARAAAVEEDVSAILVR